MRTAATLILLLTLALLATACGHKSTSSTAPTATPAVNVVPTLPPNQPTAVINPCQPNPDPATNTTNSTSFGYRVVSAPLSGAQVQTPLTVQGQAMPFEGAYSVAIFGLSGNQIASLNFNKSNLVLAFTAQVPFTVTSNTPACVWVFERSGKDGSPINVTQIPVTLKP